MFLMASCSFAVPSSSNAAATIIATVPTSSEKPDHREPVLTLHRVTSVCCTGARRLIDGRGSKLAQTAKQEKTGNADQSVSQRIERERVPLITAEAYLLHHSVSDDTCRRERRQRSCQHAVPGHDGHHQRRNSGTRGRGHRRRRQ
jgi:hypothetical protein